ncbi:glycoside hydrolase family 2 protein [Blastococcus haudaquaticus]|uniref:Glycosyl hydrolases family 2, sugar binding domain n=1 Tax=Blastococcus haudaquaticus TaxID=1938745 RepID=A0A286GGL3_9ACTN|nr:glycoside hydrolase family 2 TIM barrel-domain containing protein [Blastococcus haudaquaticus]SOD94376.1 Glycosyl hydrolases family 2, sugar binding domain [Blastococcus haudaquaticus]
MRVRATEQDGTYPRPQLVREGWTDLCGTWQLAFDDARAGLDGGWAGLADLADREVFDRDVTVPFPPESEASGVGDAGPHSVFWYRRTLRSADIAGADAVATDGSRVMLRFGAVDHSAQVWLDGALLGSHEGGQTPFSFDVTSVLAGGDPEEEHVLVVRAHDDPRDVTQPRGKQDWLDEPHSIWYSRTSGIWQPVWCEVVPAVSVEHLAWTPDLPGAAVHLGLTLREAPADPVTVAVRLELDGQLLGEHRVRVDEQRISTTVAVPALRNGQARQDMTWSPEEPRLVDATVQVLAGPAGADGERVVDEVSSYLGLRSAGAGGGAFLLNGRPYYLRSVLGQGYWPTSHLTAPDAGALRREVELTKDLGFNAVRVHQKVEDPRFLFWADRLGLLVWGETANAFAFTPEAVRRLTTEWLDVVHRDISHPCIVTWVPLNESWGVHDIATDPAQQAYATGLAALTRAVDPSRPVVSNDGWEHTDSDLWTVHDYADTGAVLAQRYGTADMGETVGRPGPEGRVIRLPGGTDRGQPLMLTEFGGVRYTPALPEEQAEKRTWGYSTASDAEDFARRLTDLLSAVHGSPVLAGFCYTQLTDTMQEANGLLDEDRRPKLPVERLRRIITGRPDAAV